MVTITGGISPPNNVILNPSSTIVPITQTTTIAMMIMEKRTARKERKKINIIKPVTNADKYKNICNSFLT